MTTTAPAVDVREFTSTIATDLVDNDTATGHHPAIGDLSFRLRREPDHDVSINEYDCYGKVEWINTRGYNPYPQRPDGFDGNAEKVDAPQHGVFWWQPPDDLERGTEGFRNLRQMVKDLAVFGFHVIGVEATHTRADGYSRTEAAWLGGVEPFADRADMVDLVADLVHEATNLLM